MSVREDYVAQAKLAEQAERYDDMAAAMKLVSCPLFPVALPVPSVSRNTNILR
jgi:hypothetical protein